MPRLILSIAVVVSLVCLATPRALQADDACYYYNSGIAWDNVRNFDAAIACYTQALRICPYYTAAYNNRGYVWNEKGDVDRAMADLNQALAINPNFASAYNNRGYSWYTKGDLDKAIADYTQALAVGPTLAEAYSNRGVAWDDKGEHDRALADLDQALAINPNIASAYTSRGTIEARRGEFEKANADFYRAISVDPNSATNFANLAFFQASCPDPRYRNGHKAFENASHGYMLDNGADAFYVNNSLAAAYAECGDFEKALTYQEKVVALAPPKDKHMESTRLELFKQGKPYRSVLQPQAE